MFVPNLFKVFALFCIFKICAAPVAFRLDSNSISASASVCASTSIFSSAVASRLERDSSTTH
eukprot:4941222-Karenia_brevis.AAC.1